MTFKKFSLLLFAGAALVTSCSSPPSATRPEASPRSQAEPSVPSIPKVRTDRLQVTRPLDTYTPDSREDKLLWQAEAAVANRCLRDLGYHRNPLDGDAASDAELNIYDFYWYPEAERLGYAVRSEATEEETWDDTAPRTQKKLLSGELTSYEGHKVPKDGCYGEAGRVLTKDAQPPRKFDEQGLTITRVSDASPRGLIDSYVSVIRQALSFQIDKDSRIKRVISQWSSCMKAKGYEYASPSEAATDKRWASSRDKAADKEEIAAATADMACKKHVRYLDKTVAVEAAYETRYISQHSKQLESFLDLRRKWKANAEQVLSDR